MCIFELLKDIKKRKLKKQISDLQYQLEVLDQQAKQFLESAEDVKFIIDNTSHIVLTENNPHINILYNRNIDTWLRDYLDYRHKANSFMFKHSIVAKKIEQLEKKLPFENI